MDVRAGKPQRGEGTELNMAWQRVIVAGVAGRESPPALDDAGAAEEDVPGLVAGRALSPHDAACPTGNRPNDVPAREQCNELMANADRILKTRIRIDLPASAFA